MNAGIRAAPRIPGGFGGPGAALSVILLQGVTDLIIRCRMLSGGLHFLTGKEAQNRRRPYFMSVNVFGEKPPLCVSRIARKVRGWGILGAGQIEKKIKSAGLLAFL